MDGWLKDMLINQSLDILVVSSFIPYKVYKILANYFICFFLFYSIHTVTDLYIFVLSLIDK